jgi:membrane-bound metal-dependent hydrolase YbcI (DUF457 family)
MAALIAPVVLRALPPSAPRATRVVLFGGVVFGTVAADLDIALGYALGQNGFHVHGEFTHSLTMALVFAMIFALWARLIAPAIFARALVAGFLAYASHLALDFVNHGRGIMLLWPLSGERYSAPFELFYGVRHSDLTDLRHHAITIATELAFAAGVVLIALPLYRGRGANGPTSGRI